MSDEEEYYSPPGQATRLESDARATGGDLLTDHDIGKHVDLHMGSGSIFIGTLAERSPHGCVLTEAGLEKRILLDTAVAVVIREKG